MQILNLSDYQILLVDNETTVDRLNNLRRQLNLETRNSVVDKNRTWLIQSKSAATDLGYINVVPANEQENEIGFALIEGARGKGVYLW